jgi:hypothetical protein
MYIWRDEEKDTERERESLKKKREKTTPTSPQKTKDAGVFSFSFFQKSGRGEGGVSKRCVWHKQHQFANKQIWYLIY